MFSYVCSIQNECIMKTYTLKLKGTKKNGTSDIAVVIKALNKSQAFNFAYQFFEKGVYTSATTFNGWRVTDFIPDAAILDKFVGKYKVYRTSII